MIDDFDHVEVRSSEELWSEICSTLPEVNAGVPEEPCEALTDSFNPSVPNGAPSNESNSGSKWEPMEDSETYIAILENRLRKIKGQPGKVTSRDMLRSLSQAKKECWDRLLHDPETSEPFQVESMEDGALERFGRWILPRFDLISAEELECLISSGSKESVGPNQTRNGTDKSRNNSGSDETEKKC